MAIETSGRRNTRTDQVYAALRGWIEEGRVAVNARFPTEMELAQSFAVSRPVVRNALSRLRADGIVRSVRGSGTTLIRRIEKDQGASDTERPAQDSAVSVEESLADLQKCFEFRALIEGEAAYLVALRHNRRTLEAIASWVHRIQGADPTTLGTFGTMLAFHNAVIEAAESPYLQQAYELVLNSPGFGVYVREKRGRVGDPMSKAQANAEHLEIVQLIERRRADDARDAMKAHIRRGLEEFLGTIRVSAK